MKKRCVILTKTQKIDVNKALWENSYMKKHDKCKINR